MTSLNTSIEPLDLLDTNGLDRWYQRFSLYTRTNENITEENRTAYYLTLIGKEAFNLLVDLNYPEDVAEKRVTDLHQSLKTHLQPTNFEATERSKFHNIMRKSDEKLRDFLLRLQQQAAKCNFGDQLQTALRDRIIAGVNHPDVQRKLLSRRELTYQ